MTAWSSLLLFGCSAQKDAPAAGSDTAIQSIRTELRPESCAKRIDKDDPNETPYQVCPGVAGYSLIVRLVDAGRQSIDIVDPVKLELPLHYEEFITRHMSTVGDQAEWRVATKEGKPVPVALIVRVNAREDDAHPEKVTRSYFAVAKITPGQACVTDRMAAGTQPEADVRRAADSAQARHCAPAQPPLRADGIVIR
jgi:hypothetical protein